MDGWHAEGRGRAAAVVLAIALVGGCTEDDALSRSPPYASGSRLRARVFDGGHGAVRLAGWRDTQLELDCRFERASDGVMRCLPAASFEIAYLDDACTRPVAIADRSSTCDAAPLAREPTYDPGTCAPRSATLYELGEPLGPGMVYERASNGCFEWWSDERLAAGAVADPARYAGGPDVIEPRGDGLAVRTITTEDGARQILHAVDAGGDDCEHTYLPTGGEVCVGATAIGGGSGHTFRDDACTRPVPAVRLGCGDAVPDVVFADDGGAYLPGARLEGPLYTDVDAACGMASGAVAYELGPRATSDDFPTMTTAFAGTTPLETFSAADHWGLPLIGGGFVQVDGWRGCTPMQVGDDPTDLRCVAYDWGQSVSPPEWFADPACTTPVKAWGQSADDLGKLVADIDLGCEVERLVSLYTLREHPGPTYRLDGDGCREATPEWDGRPLIVDHTIAVETLAPITLRTE